ncbi:hypothetical protein PT287_09620 [Lactobacillus sp. ESL0679]|uniref:hypothetical protein n=1 Tax=Lactobacillus sp. ESL0679 TaxID=2983209 RepID=UPI0023F9C310|nr:hypothetical protein [Lactobacillus sp. ESL0679]MDF7683755.1 hypothetical protein [Lactobacillus sp. ESL0679]
MTKHELLGFLLFKGEKMIVIKWTLSAIYILLVIVGCGAVGSNRFLGRLVSFGHTIARLFGKETNSGTKV